MTSLMDAALMEINDGDLKTNNKGKITKKNLRAYLKKNKRFKDSDDPKGEGERYRIIKKSGKTLLGKRPTMNESLMNEPLMNESLMNEPLMNEPLMNESLMNERDKPVNPPSINELLKRVKERGIGKITKQTKNNKTQKKKKEKKQKQKQKSRSKK
jgi:hypothetical protein